MSKNEQISNQFRNLQNLKNSGKISTNFVENQSDLKYSQDASKKNFGFVSKIPPDFPNQFHVDLLDQTKKKLLLFFFI